MYHYFSPILSFYLPFTPLLLTSTSPTKIMSIRINPSTPFSRKENFLSSFSLPGDSAGSGRDGMRWNWGRGKEEGRGFGPLVGRWRERERNREFFIGRLFSSSVLLPPFIQWNCNTTRVFFSLWLTCVESGPVHHNRWFLSFRFFIFRSVIIPFNPLFWILPTYPISHPRVSFRFVRFLPKNKKRGVQRRRGRKERKARGNALFLAPLSMDQNLALYMIQPDLWFRQVIDKTCQDGIHHDVRNWKPTLVCIYCTILLVVLLAEREEGDWKRWMCILYNCRYFLCVYNDCTYCTYEIMPSFCYAK